MIINIKYDTIWYNKLEQLKKYIDEHNKRPSSEDVNKEIKELGCWCLRQIHIYINKKHIWDDDINQEWNEFINNIKYKELFEDNETKWINKLNEVKLYIDENKKRPPSCHKNKEIRILGSWISNQLLNYKNKNCIMLNEQIYNKWTDFINDNKYKIYFEDNNIIWINTLEKIKKYIDDNNKRPTNTDKNKEIKILGSWIGTQIQNYKNKIQIMSDEEIYNKWIEFINDNKYKKYFNID